MPSEVLICIVPLLSSTTKNLGMCVNKAVGAFSVIHMVMFLFPRECGMLGFQYAGHISLEHAHE